MSIARNTVSAADLQLRKLGLIEWLTRLDDEKTIREIEELQRKRGIAKYESKLKPMTQAELIRRARQSERDIKAGRVISSEELEREIATW